MNFNKHSELIGKHAFLCASKYHWVNYDEEKLNRTYLNYLAVQRGIELHEFAKRCIELGRKQPKTKDPLNQFVNDAIGYRMVPEQVLFYSYNAFGTADAIGFKDGLLRIHDLKTGATPASMQQLEVYAALFCLEYDENPLKINVELRIYQTENVVVHNPTGHEILSIADKIVLFDKQIDKIRMEVQYV